MSQYSTSSIHFCVHALNMLQRQCVAYGFRACVFSRSTPTRMTLAVIILNFGQLVCSYESSSWLYLPLIGLIWTIKSNSVMKRRLWCRTGGRLKEDFSSLMQWKHACAEWIQYKVRWRDWNGLFSKPLS